MIINKLAEKEIQALIIIIELSEPVETENVNYFSYTFYPKTEEDATRYFCGFNEDKEEGKQLLIKKRFIDKENRLTEKGKVIAREVRRLRPPIYYWYRKYYKAIENSIVFNKANKEIYGVDIDQFGFSGINQIEKLIELLDLSTSTLCLDIGCGNGKITEYIANKTGSIFIGIDYIPEAIESAKRRMHNTNMLFKRYLVNA